MLQPAFQTGHVTVHLGHALDVLRALPEESVDSCVTSPPYWGLRAYGTRPQVWGGDPAHEHAFTLGGGKHIETTEKGGNWTQAANGPELAGAGHQTRFKGDTRAAEANRTFAVTDPDECACGAWRGEYGLESSLALYVDHTVEIFREVRRVLRAHGTLWLNIGDSYAQDGKWGGAGDGSLDGRVNRAQYPRTKKTTGLKPKDMVGMPWRIAFALQDDGWYLRSDIIWAKPNPMPESVGDRPTKAHEYVFLFAKEQRYFYDAAAIAEPLTAASLARISQASFDAQKGGPTGENGNRSQRRALENLHAKTIVPDDPSPEGGLWHTPGKNSRVNADRDPRHLEDGGKQERRLYKTDEHNRFGKASANRVWDDVDALDRMIANGRNARTVWEIATQPYPEAHFATFPEELPRRCILAGTPAQVCSVCGKARTRISQTTYAVRAIRASTEKQADTGDTLARANMPFMGDAARETVGWTDCGHGAYVAGTVLDPFAGSGTTLAVARDLGRLSVGIELHDDYLDLIRRRCQQEAFTW